MDKLIDKLAEQGIVGAVAAVSIFAFLYFFKKYNTEIENKIKKLISLVDKFDSKMDSAILGLKKSMALHSEDLDKAKKSISEDFLRLRENSLRIKEELSDEISKAQKEVEYLKLVQSHNKENFGKVEWIKDEIKEMRSKNFETRKISETSKQESEKNRQALEQAKKIFGNHKGRLDQQQEDIKKIATILKKKKSKEG